jgi:acetoin:2,6-dichlorophenolindophenol oxidoreductase subunit beta
MDREITYIEAVRETFRAAMTKDETVFIIGEDVKIGIFATTRGLYEEFGPQRVLNSPICENAIIGTAVGAAVSGMRPVAQIMFADFVYLAMDEIANQAGQWHYITGGQLKVPLVIEIPTGARGSSGYNHSQSPEASFIHPPGLKVVCPSTPRDAKGLLWTSIFDDNPVLFFEHRRLLALKDNVPEEVYEIPFGVADVKREGKHATIVAYGWMVHQALKAAQKMESEGIDLEVVDLRTLVPMDMDTIYKSLEKTGRLVIAEECRKKNGVGAEIAATVLEEKMDLLDAPVRRVSAPNIPIPFSPPLEEAYLPRDEDIIRAVKSIL